MGKTATESRIIERRKASGIVVPILEDTFERQLSLEDEQDQWFMIELMKARARPREKGVFSPSMLGSCVRQAYFAKTRVEKKPAKSPRSNGYFHDGDFRHYKWQFALWKAHRAGYLELHGCEIRVFHPNGDFAGTIDAVVSVPDKFGKEMFPIDFKGMRVDAFQKFEKYGAPMEYRIQLVGYGEIVNQACAFESFMGSFLGVKVERCLLIGENKGGPGSSGSPLGIREEILYVKKDRAKVKRRIHQLREFVKDEETPPPSCTSTRTKTFQECPFSYLCRNEVKAIQREREGHTRSGERELRVARPSR